MKHQRTLQLLALILAGLLWTVATALSGAQAPEVSFWDGNRAPAGQPVSAGAVPRAYGPSDPPADCPVGNPLSIDFLGQESHLDDSLLPVGAVVRAYDPTGLVVGCSIVASMGWYLMPVYGDRTDTPAEREGARLGDQIAFTVSHHQAVPLGPAPAIWDPALKDEYERIHVELRACTLAGDFNCDCRVDVADIQGVAARWGIVQGQKGYYPPYDPDGDGIDVGDVQRVALVWRGTC